LSNLYQLKMAAQNTQSAISGIVSAGMRRQKTEHKEDVALSCAQWGDACRVLPRRKRPAGCPSFLSGCPFAFG
jgi:hypothetical protein